MNRFCKKSIFVFLVLSCLSLSIYSQQIKLLITSLIWAGIVALIHFMMAKTARISFYRTIFFAILTIAFLLEMHVFFEKETTFLPYCHIGMAGNMLHIIYNEFLAFSNFTFFKYGALSIGILWLFVILINGGGFCSYVCFFGGIDSTLSKLLKKPLIKIKPSEKIREFQLAVLIFFVLISFLYSQPIFCLWFCPLKLSESIINPNSRSFIFQSALFISVGLVFLIILPIVTKKRFFCSMICPFGALPPLIHKFIPYKVTINKTSCISCGKCMNVCPSFAINKKKNNKIQITRYCTLCMTCAGKCPTKSIRPTLYNRKETELIPFVSMILAGAISLFYLPQAVLHLLKVF
ncbi:MAG: 4Fe-4S binding protein [Lentisphaerota bacterium]